jgi:hypothetical protein
MFREQEAFVFHRRMLLSKLFQVAPAEVHFLGNAEDVPDVAPLE